MQVRLLPRVTKKIKHMKKSEVAIKTAIQKGYRVVNGAIEYKGRTRMLQKDRHGYLYFSIRIPLGQAKVFVHRLVAFQKYGDLVFEDGMQVRHLNGDQTNNSNQNISIGTASQNNMDKPKWIRQKAAKRAAMAKKKHDHSAIIMYHQKTNNYTKTMAAFGIGSKGTLHFILNDSDAARDSIYSGYKGEFLGRI